MCWLEKGTIAVGEETCRGGSISVCGLFVSCGPFVTTCRLIRRELDRMNDELLRVKECYLQLTEESRGLEARLREEFEHEKQALVEQVSRDELSSVRAAVSERHCCVAVQHRLLFVPHKGINEGALSGRPVLTIALQVAKTAFFLTTVHIIIYKYTDRCQVERKKDYWDWLESHCRHEIAIKERVNHCNEKAQCVKNVRSCA